MPRAVNLPNDVESLKRLVIEAHTALQAAEARLLSRQLEIEALKLQIAQLRRMKFGRSSERFDEQIRQLEFKLEELESEEASLPTPPTPAAPAREKPVRRALPAHLPREKLIHELWRDDLGERCATIKMEIGLRSVGIMPVLIVADKCYASA